MKDIKTIINEINEETKQEGERIAKQVNEDKELNTWFSKWNYGVGLLQKRGEVVMEIQKVLRSQGYDVKINMQSYELSYYGLINEEEK